jgi:hypothetical protein
MTVYSLCQAYQSIKSSLSRAFGIDEESHKEELARLSRRTQEARERKAATSSGIVDFVLEDCFSFSERLDKFIKKNDDYPIKFA